MNTKIKALLAFTAIFVIGFGSGYLFSDVTTSNEASAEWPVIRRGGR